jgi:hypothetical protein
VSTLQTIAIDDLKLFASCNAARLGALLQVEYQNKPLIGLRCEIDVSGPRPCLLALAGTNELGVLLQDEFLLRPAIDVSGLFDLVIDEPKPTRCREEHMSVPGLVCEVGPGSGVLIVRAIFSSRHSAIVYLRDKANPTGTTVVDQPPRAQVSVIGKLSIARKQRPHQN